MKTTSLIAALVATVVTTFVSLPSALACDPAPATPQAIVPINGDRVSTKTQILVVGQGTQPSEGGEYSLSDRTGNQVEVEAQTFQRAGLFQWIVVYRPKEALSPTAYDFFVSYSSGEQNSETIGTSFEVLQQDPATLARPRVSSWDTIYFAPQVEGQCESYSSKTRVVIDRAREGDSPLWYEVELSNEDRSDVVTRAVVPGVRDDDGASMRREFREDFAVGCVAVTAVGPAGERGESFESCEPTLCGRADGRTEDLEGVWESIDECGGSAPGQPSTGGSSSASSSSEGGCSVRQPARPGSPWRAVVVVLVAMSLFVSRAKQRD